MTSRIAALTGMLLLGLLLRACGPSPSYVHENELLLNDLPQYPGSERLDVSRYAYSRSEGGPWNRHSINVTFKAPPGVTDHEVVDFYIDALGKDWQYKITGIPMVEIVERGTPEPTPIAWSLNVEFDNGLAKITVNTDGMSFGDGDTFDVGIDARANEPP
ncbi:MAG: hypothetical protein MUP15_02295 [Dehalococcoidia bacterium]|nr:hypothetical protein [Dehalococcoidia bacterium]